MLKISTLTTRREIKEFLESTGFCRLSIPKFVEVAKSLYEATKESQPFFWAEVEDKVFNKIKKALLLAPALGLPGITKPFHLYIDERKGIAKGVLTQTLGPWEQASGLSIQKTRPSGSQWAPMLRDHCCHSLAVKDAGKLTMGLKLLVTTPHIFEGCSNSYLTDK